MKKEKKTKQQFLLINYTFGCIKTVEHEQQRTYHSFLSANFIIAIAFTHILFTLLFLCFFFHFTNELNVIHVENVFWHFLDVSRSSSLMLFLWIGPQTNGNFTVIWFIRHKRILMNYKWMRFPIEWKLNWLIQKYTKIWQIKHIFSFVVFHCWITYVQFWCENQAH